MNSVELQAYLSLEDSRAQRQFLPPGFILQDWEGLEPYFDALLAEDLSTAEALEAWLRKRSELDALLSEDFAWRYIRMTCDTGSEAHRAAYQFYLEEIQPRLAVYDDRLNRKAAESPGLAALDPQRFQTYLRRLKRQIELFRDENVPLEIEAETKAQEFQALAGAMTIEQDGKTLTLTQASKLLEDPKRQLRQEVWEKIAARRLQDREKIEAIFGQLLELRSQIARNAGYESYTRFRFDQLERFDYSPEDTQRFHEAVASVVTPVYAELMEGRRQRLGLERLRPWDLSVDLFGDRPLRPFQDGQELLNKTVAALSALRPELGEMLRIMERRGYLDLESRVGKAPGGYNYPLAESGAPFVFMNAAGSQSDVLTLLHESGHAIHAFLTHPLPYSFFKHPPMEVAELASMSMELLALDEYRQFYADPAELARAQKDQLLNCITVFPWIAAVDAFQQWAYDHPEASAEERRAAWTGCYRRFHGEAVDWSGYESYLEALWLKQGHIFEVPFYYIEYAIAQLGALAVWNNYRRDPTRALEQYLEALRAGYTRPIPELYALAGIRFDFSASYMESCVQGCLEAYRSIEIVAERA
jgi:oligoendopeptidase F